MSKRSILMILVLLAIAMVAIGSFASFYLAPSSHRALTQLRVGHLLADQLHQPGWVVAKENDYFFEEGFEVVHSEYPYGSVEMEHFAAGELDVAYVGAVPFLSARAAGVDIVAVASSNSEGSSLVVTQEIQNVSGLAGKTIGSPGFGSIQDYMLDRVKEMYNVDFSVDRVEVTLLPVKFSTGEIDGYIAWEPHAIQVVVEEVRGAHVLLSSREILSNHQCCVVAVRGDWVRDAPYLVRRIVRWHMKAMRWVLEHPEAAESLIANSSGRSLELIRAAHSIVTHSYPPYVDVASSRIMLEGQIAAGKIKSEKVPDLDAFLSESIDNSFVENLHQELQSPTVLYSSRSAGLLWNDVPVLSGKLISAIHPKFPRAN